MTTARLLSLLFCLPLLLPSGVCGQETAAEAEPPAPVNVKGSQIPHEEMRCATCHTEEALWDEQKQHLFISQEILARDAHWQKGVGCSDCHGGDPSSLNYAEAHAGLTSGDKIRDKCFVCHKEQRLEIVKGVHANAGEKDARGRGLPLDCSKCHGANAHEMVPSTNELSPVFHRNQVNTCGSCHPEDQKTFGNTAHGQGLLQSGLMVTAVCADCHGSHAIYYAADRRSTLHPSNVATTCSKCHESIEQRLEASVHRRSQAEATTVEPSGVAGKVKRRPVCTDCHDGHPSLSPDLARFRPPIDDRCGNCHSELYSRYSHIMHARLTDHGYSAAANCAECHGGHDILAVDHPQSPVGPIENRLHTCQKCHTYAVTNFAQYDPHANFKNAFRYPSLHTIHKWINFALNLIFACFLIHAVLWFVRAFIDRLLYGGDTPLRRDQYVLPRYDPIQRGSYAALLIAFLGLALTGMALKYSNQSWAQSLAGGMGGFRSTGIWHQLFAMFAVVVFAVYLVQSVASIFRRRREQSWSHIVLGPDSLVPNGRDLSDIYRMSLWFIGLGPKPGFEKWAYWEKLDYWAFLLIAALIGLSGMMFWFPNLFCLILPGYFLNVAKMVHSEFALYAASFLFLIHFFHAHFRAEKFPMDLSVMTGMAGEEHLRQNRPDYIARLEREGKLSQMRRVMPSRRNVWLTMAGGLVVYTLGLCLLAAAVFASLEE